MSVEEGKVVTTLDTIKHSTPFFYVTTNKLVEFEQ